MELVTVLELLAVLELAGELELLAVLELLTVLELLASELALLLGWPAPPQAATSQPVASIQARRNLARLAPVAETLAVVTRAEL